MKTPDDRYCEAPCYTNKFSICRKGIFNVQDLRPPQSGLENLAVGTSDIEVLGADVPVKERNAEALEWVVNM